MEEQQNFVALGITGLGTEWSFHFALCFSFPKMRKQLVGSWDLELRLLWWLFLFSSAFWAWMLKALMYWRPGSWAQRLADTSSGPKAFIGGCDKGGWIVGEQITRAKLMFFFYELPGVLLKVFFKPDKYNLKCKKAEALHMAAVLNFVWLSSACYWTSDDPLPLRKTNFDDIPALKLLRLFSFEIPVILPLNFLSISCL